MVNQKESLVIKARSMLQHPTTWIQAKWIFASVRRKFSVTRSKRESFSESNQTSWAGRNISQGMPNWIWLKLQISIVFKTISLDGDTLNAGNGFMLICKLYRNEKEFKLKFSLLKINFPRKQALNKHPNRKYFNNWIADMTLLIPSCACCMKGGQTLASFRRHALVRTWRFQLFPTPKESRTLSCPDPPDECTWCDRNDQSSWPA